MNLQQALITIYIASVVGLILMKKIQPNKKAYLGYAVWVVFICVVFTIFLTAYVSQATAH